MKKFSLVALVVFLVSCAGIREKEPKETRALVVHPLGTLYQVITLGPRIVSANAISLGDGTIVSVRDLFPEGARSISALLGPVAVTCEEVEDNLRRQRGLVIFRAYGAQRDISVSLGARVDVRAVDTYSNWEKGTPVYIVGFNESEESLPDLVQVLPATITKPPPKLGGSERAYEREMILELSGKLHGVTDYKRLAGGAVVWVDLRIPFLIGIVREVRNDYDVVAVTPPYVPLPRSSPLWSETQYQRPKKTVELEPEPGSKLKPRRR